MEVLGHLGESAGEAEPEGTSLSGVSTTHDGGIDVEPASGSSNLERLGSQSQDTLIGEVGLSLASVDGHLAGTSLNEDACDSVLPASSGVVNRSSVLKIDSLDSSHLSLLLLVLRGDDDRGGIL